VVNRDQGGCTLCHEVPGETRFGNVAPTLAGVGAKLSAAQLRLRVADSTRVNPNTPMPAYYRTQGLVQVAAAYRGKPILSARQVEDVVAFLATLKEAK
jgi:sulfur-oxidizing protein SoxX